MKNNMKNTIITAFAIFGLALSANAASLPSVLATPTNITKGINESFVASVNLSANNTAVYAVEGTITFENLTCESIKVADGLMPQTTPTCAQPYFLIGIPNGTTKDIKIADINVRGKAIGEAKIIFSKVDVIGAGKSLSTEFTNGIYNITSGNSVGSMVGGKLGTQASSTNTASKVGYMQSTKSTGGKTATLVDDTNTAKATNNFSQLASVIYAGFGTNINWLLIIIIIL